VAIPSFEVYFGGAEAECGGRSVAAARKVEVHQTAWFQASWKPYRNRRRVYMHRFTLIDRV